MLSGYVEVFAEAVDGGGDLFSGGSQVQLAGTYDQRLGLIERPHQQLPHDSLGGHGG